MDGYSANVILLVIVSIMWLFTLAACVGAMKRWREVRRWHINGDMKAYTDQNVRHEWVRIVKHSLIVGTVAASIILPREWWDAHNEALIRNTIIAVIGSIIGINSLLDIRDRRNRWRSFLRTRM